MLTVGGDFTAAGNNESADYVAQWTGQVWVGLMPTNVSPAPLNGAVRTMLVDDSDLYVGGDFTTAIGPRPTGTVDADHLARYDGYDWFAVAAADASTAPLQGSVSALAKAGNMLYAGGAFVDADSKTGADYIAAWDGSKWSAVGNDNAAGALDGPVQALVVAGNDLYVGGRLPGCGRQRCS